MTGIDSISCILEPQNVDVHLESYEVPEIEEEDFSNSSPDVFEGSDIMVDEAKALAFCSHFELSDECSSTMHMMMKTFLSKQNQFPSGYQDIRQMKRSFSEEIRVVENSPRQSLCITGFRYQLRDIIQQNISEIFDYSEYRKKNIHSEFNCVLCPPVEVKQNRELFIHLILFSEGVNNKKSTLRKQLWPVCLQIADLPPRRRNSRQNIVLIKTIKS